jgi:hypothetical protein
MDNDDPGNALEFEGRNSKKREKQNKGRGEIEFIEKKRAKKRWKEWEEREKLED